MKSGKTILWVILLALYAVLLALCIVLAAKCSAAVKSAAALPEVRSDGTMIQWRCDGESEWNDLVALDTLRGTAGENGADGSSGQDGADGIDGKNGADGKDGVNGKDGADGKAIEVRSADSHIQWRYVGETWQNLVALADLEGPAGQDGKDGKTPEFRVNGSELQWRYVGDAIWLNLYDLSVLKGLDGSDGAAGKDGETPFIGENGNWWIGMSDTGVKAEGLDGKDGEKGEKGEKGDTGETGPAGPAGPAGEDGGCPGWFYATGNSPRVFLQERKAYPHFAEKLSSGGLVSCSDNTVTLQAGHTYSVCISGSIAVSANNDSGQFCVVMLDGYDDELSRRITRTQHHGGEMEMRNIQQSFVFSRIYNAKDGAVTLRFAFEQEDYDSLLDSFDCMITVIALD